MTDESILPYDAWIEDALRGVIRQALAQAAASGLPGDHHFYITFRTDDPETELPERLRQQYPDEMTVVLQHQFDGLEVGDDSFGVTLYFGGVPTRLHVPFAAITSFADPSVNFGLQLKAPEDMAEEDEDELEDFGDEPETLDRRIDTAAETGDETDESDGDDDGDGGGKSGEVIALDKFRKKQKT